MYHDLHFYRIVTVSWDKSAIYWDYATGKKLVKTHVYNENDAFDYSGLTITRPSSPAAQWLRI
jgi:hypothetical protein